MLEQITVSGLPAFKAITVTLSAEEAVRTAQIDLDPTGVTVPVVAGQPVEIRAGRDLLLTGFVRDVRPSHDGGSRELSVTVCSRTVDATECSVEHSSGEVLNKDLSEIAKEFDHLKIGIESDGGLPIEPRHKLRDGETLFSSLERRARGRGILIYDTPKGRLKLATKPEGTHRGGLYWGQNIKSASSELTERGRYSSVMVRGQTTVGSSKQQLRAQTTARDTAVTRDRPLVIIHEGETTTDRLTKRAEWQAKRGAGEASTATVTVLGWRDAGGNIWNRNWLVYVRDEWIAIDGLMIIKSVSLSQDGASEGTTATLSLADPRALGGENPRGNTSRAYSAPGSVTVEYEDE